MKKKMKSLTVLVIAFMMLAILSACGADAGSNDASKDTTAKNKTQTLKVAFNQPDTHPQFKAMEHSGTVL